MFPQGSSLRGAGEASVCDQMRVPVSGSNAITSLRWVATMTRSCPPAPPSQYRGWAYTAPCSGALKAVSCRSFPTAARVSDAST